MKIQLNEEDITLIRDVCISNQYSVDEAVSAMLYWGHFLHHYINNGYKLIIDDDKVLLKR